MDDELVVTVDGLRMFGRPGLGPFVLLKDGLDGWDDGVPMRGEKIARAQQHGAYSLPRFQESRTVTLTGIILAASRAEQIMLGRRVSGLLATGRAGRIQVQRKSGTLWTDAFLDAAPKVDPRRGTFMTDFQVQLWCPDARLFGEMNSFTATVGAPATVYHWGNHPSWPAFSITGNMPGGYTLTVEGINYVVSAPLVPGQTHTVDYNDGRLRINGELATVTVLNTNLRAIEPGRDPAVGIYPTAGGTGTAVITVPDTYI